MPAMGPVRTRCLHRWGAFSYINMHFGARQAPVNVASREVSCGFTRQRSQVRALYRPPQNSPDLAASSLPSTGLCWPAHASHSLACSNTYPKPFSGRGRSSKRLNARANLAFSQGHSATSQCIFLWDYIMITPYDLNTSLIEPGALIVLAHHLQS